MLRSMLAQSQYLSSFVIWVCIDNKLLVSAMRSSVYATKLLFAFDVLKVYACSLHCNHLSNVSVKLMKKYGLRVSPLIEPLFM
jgi:hypothetical protein